LEDLEKNCATKTGEFEEHCKIRAEELLALADTIKILNDDDALELFKKTLPAPSASFVQVAKSMAAVQARARSALQSVYGQANDGDRMGLDLISLALHGKKIGFDKVIKMIDDMIVTLKKEQVDDDSKKAYCAKELDLADDKKKSLERSVADTETLIANTKEELATTSDEIAALKASIAALDKSVVEASQQRSAENADFKTLMAEDSAAKELLGFAKNRLNKFYNPKLYKPPAKEELSAMDRTFESSGGASLSQANPGAPPATVAKEYSKKSGETSGVIQMIDMLIMDLDKEMTEATATEKDSQADYEQMMTDSANKRTQDSKTLVDKESHKADMEAQLDKGNDDLGSFNKNLASTNNYIGQLHSECDWLVKYYDVRQAARSSEIDALGKAKAVLSGADYSLLQMNAGFLSRN
jgi:predicted  nucleic acid-binding Zn-ribbon protein